MKSILKYFFVSILCLLMVEGILRLIGFRPFPDMEVGNEKSEPGEYAGFHPMYGPYPLPGKFRVDFGRGWCLVTHTKDSTRITRPETDTTDYSGKPKLTIYGCSFTWGEGISDSSTYPYLVQAAMPSYNVQNKGVFAAGDIVSYLQIKEEIRRHEQPAIALVSYASFHDQRNTLDREWSTYMKESFKAGGDQSNTTEVINANRFIDTLRFPYARLIKDSLQIIYTPLKSGLFPLSKYSAISNAINNIINHFDDKELKNREVTRLLFSEINSLCKKNGTRLIVTCICNDKNTVEMEQYLRSAGIEYLSFGLDIDNDLKYNLYPDQHPNERANKIYSQKIIDYLSKHT